MVICISTCVPLRQAGKSLKIRPDLRPQTNTPGNEMIHSTRVIIGSHS